MRSGNFASQRGFSLLKILLLIVIIAVVASALRGRVSIVNQRLTAIERTVRGITQGITARFVSIKNAISQRTGGIGDRLSEMIKDLKDRWCRFRGTCVVSRSMDWVADMKNLIDRAREEGYDMKEVLLLWNLYNQGNQGSQTTCYMLTDASLDNLRADNLPEIVLKSLTPLINKKYCTVPDFFTAVRTAIMTYLLPNKKGTACFIVTDAALDNFEHEGMPVAVRKNIEKDLRGEKFCSEADFLKALETTLGSSLTNQYQDIMLKYTLRSCFALKESDFQSLSNAGIPDSVITGIRNNPPYCWEVAEGASFPIWLEDRLADPYTDPILASATQVSEQGGAPPVSELRVEAEFWYQMQTQTATFIYTHINRFRTRPLGCSDFSIELKKIKEISDQFNLEEFEGYIRAKQLSEELDNPRSLEFARDLFVRLNAPHSQKYLDQLYDAITNPIFFTITDNVWNKLKTEGFPDEILIKLVDLRNKEPMREEAFVNALRERLKEEYYVLLVVKYAKKVERFPDYPKIVKRLDEQSPNTVFDPILTNYTVGEIYLNHDLIGPAEERFDRAIQNLADMIAQYGKRFSPDRIVGLHMALGLLNERVCRNNDLAVKEFKDVIACAKRVPDLSCEEYSPAHFHLGVINLRVREASQTQTGFVEQPSATAATTDQLLEATPVPVPTPTPTPTPVPQSLEITIKVPLSRSIIEEAKATSPRALKKGKVDDSPRKERLRPRQELGDTRKMAQFRLEDLYDLSRIPDNAVREFELYLQCKNQGHEADVARFVRDKYLGK